MYQFRWSYQDTYTKNQDSRQDTYAKNQDLMKIQDWSVIKRKYNIKIKLQKCDLPKYISKFYKESYKNSNVRKELWTKLKRSEIKWTWKVKLLGQ